VAHSARKRTCESKTKNMSQAWQPHSTQFFSKRQDSKSKERKLPSKQLADGLVKGMYYTASLPSAAKCGTAYRYIMKYDMHSCQLSSKARRFCHLRLNLHTHVSGAQGNFS
jgi:hypothetical protein